MTPRRRHICHLLDSVPGWAWAPGSGMGVKAQLTSGCLIPESSRSQEGQEHFRHFSPNRKWGLATHAWGKLTLKDVSSSSLTCVWGNYFSNPSPPPDGPFCGSGKPIWSFPHSLCEPWSLSMTAQGLKRTSCSAVALMLCSCNWELMCTLASISWSYEQFFLAGRASCKCFTFQLLKLTGYLPQCHEVIYHSESLTANKKIHTVRLTSKLIYWRIIVWLTEFLGRPEDHTWRLYSLEQYPNHFPTTAGVKVPLAL